MIHRTGPGSARPVLRLAGLLLVMVAAFAATSCSKKITDVDSALVPPNYPEGIADASKLLLYPDTPVPVETWQDNGDPGPDTADVLLSSTLVYSERAGAVLGLIVDHTPASQFQVFRRQGANGYIEMNDFAIQPSKTFLESQYDVFHFTDPSPYPGGQREYVARGVVSGLVTRNAPLTNRVSLTATSVAGNLAYTGRVLPDTTRDSTFVLRWNSVAGAAGYWLTVTRYPPSFLANDALIRFALPRPVTREKLPDVYVAYVPDPNGAGGQARRQKLGDPLPDGGKLLHEDIGTNGALYFARIVAVDAGGQVLSTIGANGSYAQAASLNEAGRPIAGQYRIFPMAGVFVQPQRETEIGDELRSGAAGSSSLRSLDLGNGIRIYDGAALRRVLQR